MFELLAPRTPKFSLDNGIEMEFPAREAQSTFATAHLWFRHRRIPPGEKDAVFLRIALDFLVDIRCRSIVGNGLM